MQPGLPVFMDNTPSGISEQILWLVKNSGLNFSVQETAFSLNIQLKKLFLNKWAVNDGLNQNFTKNPSKEFVRELQAKDEKIDELVKSLKQQQAKTVEAQDNLDALSANKLKAFNDEKKTIQVKHEKLSADHKILKGENIELMKDLNALKVAMKSFKKESIDTAHKNQKKVENLVEGKLEELVQFKINKESEEKALRAKTKKLDKKMKTIQEKEAELKVARNRLDKPVIGAVGPIGLGVTSADDPENNSVTDPVNPVDKPNDNSVDAIAPSNDSILEETKGSEVKDPVIEAKKDEDTLEALLEEDPEDNRLTKAWLKEVMDKFKAEYGI